MTPSWAPSARKGKARIEDKQRRSAESLRRSLAPGARLGRPPGKRVAPALGQGVVLAGAVVASLSIASTFLIPLHLHAPAGDPGVLLPFRGIQPLQLSDGFQPRPLNILVFQVAPPPCSPPHRTDVHHVRVWPPEGFREGCERPPRYPKRSGRGGAGPAPVTRGPGRVGTRQSFGRAELAPDL